MIYSGGKENEPAIDALTAVAILVHELGHQYGELDHLFLDILGNKVKSYRLGFLEQLDLRRYRQDIFKVTAHNHSTGMFEQRGWLGFPETHMTIENGYDLWDITAKVNQAASCANGVIEPRSRHFSGIIWSPLQSYDEVKDRQPLTFSFEAEVECNTPTKQFIETYRIEATGLFRVGNYVSGVGLVDSRYGKDWKFSTGNFLILDEPTLKLKKL